MIKKIKILGMQVDNYTTREALLRLDTFMNSTVLNVIETVTMKQLIASAEKPVIRECLEQADLCIIGDREILSETGNATGQHMREIKDQDFMHEFVKRTLRNQKRIFLIADTRAEVEKLQGFFAEMNPAFEDVGSYAMEECAGDMDTVVNEINGLTPDVIVSALPSPDEEEFLLSHKDKIDASVWYGVGTAYNQKQKGIQVRKTIRKLALRNRLHHFMSNYPDEKQKR